MATEFKNSETIRANLIKELVLENKKTQRTDNTAARNTKASNDIIKAQLAKLK